MPSIHRQLLLFAACAALSTTGFAGDNNGDGKSDILWRNGVTGQNWLYVMNGASIAGSAGVNTVANPDWQIVSDGDYNGDGMSDILWRNRSTGQNWLYTMNGASITSSTGVNTVVDPNWTIAGGGDYNGDGQADILWRNIATGQNWLYLMNGASIASSVGVNTVAAGSWKIAGDGDFNGDGRADILWRNSITGQNWLYLMNGATIVSSAGINTVANTDWVVAGNADYNGDGRADILWRNLVTGQNWLYLMNGATIAASVGVNTVPDSNWQVAGDGDYNGDGRADILWRNIITGQNWLYLMDGASIIGSAGVNTVADTDWQIVGSDDTLPFDIGPTQDAHLKWRVQLPGPHSLVRPAVGPDGTVYAVDAADNLVAVAANGVPQWIVANAGSKGVDVGPDGTIYTGNEDWIKAFNPNGSVKWTYMQSPRPLVCHDVAVGPDGHVYGLTSSGMGVFSLDDTPSGPVLRWSNPEPYTRLFVDYTELSFGPTSDGQDQQLYLRINDHTRAIRLSDGVEVFELSGQSLTQRPVVSPFDGTWHVSDAAYTPDGNNVWTFNFGTSATAIEPAIGQSGIHYTISQGQSLYAINPDGSGRYSLPLDENVGSPDVNPAETQLLLPTSATFSHSSGVKAVSASNGGPLWRMEFPIDTQGFGQNVNSRVAFSADGLTAYVMTTNPSGSFPSLTYLNALDIDPTIPSASTQMRSVDIAMSWKAKGQSFTFTGIVTVVDENRNPVSGAQVSATWTLPDSSTVNVVQNTNNSGDATFSQDGPGGLYMLDVTDVSKSGYTFDADNSIVSDSIIKF